MTRRYRLYVSLCVESLVDIRAALVIKFQVNGVDIPGQGSSGYIRGHGTQLLDTSQGCFEVLRELTAGDQIRVTTTMAGNTGTTTVVPGESVLMIQTI